MRISPKSGLFTTLLGATTALAALSIDMSLPALPAMTTALSASGAAAQWTLSLFVLGFAGGQLFMGPLSDRFGRRPILLFGLFLYVAAGIGCATATSIEMLVSLRFLQGLSACAGAVVVRAIIRDIFDRPSAAAKQSIMTVVTTLAMLIAPIVGAWVLGKTSWRGVFAMLPIFGVIVFALVAFIIPETRPERDEKTVGAVKSYLIVLKEPVTLGNAFVAAFIFAGLFVFISASPTVFIKTLGITPQGFSWLFAVVAFGQLCGSSLNRVLAMRVASARLIRVGCAISIVSTLMIAFLTIWWTNIYIVTFAISLYAFALGMTNPNAIAAAMVPLPQYAGTASAIIGFLYFTMGSFGASLVGYIMPGTVEGMLGIITVFGAAGVSTLIIMGIYTANLAKKLSCEPQKTNQ